MRLNPAVWVIFGAFSGGVLGTDFYITSPYSAVSWKAGETVKITWNVIAGGSDVSSVQVDLMDGDDSNAHVLMPIASGVSPSTTGINWQVPENFQKSTTVFIRVRGQGSAGLVDRYSHRFLIDAPQAPVQAVPISVSVKSEGKVHQQQATTTTSPTTMTGTATTSPTSPDTTTTSETTSEETEITDSIPTLLTTIRRRDNSSAPSPVGGFTSLALVALLVIGLL